MRKVKHKIYGEGFIKNERYGGYEVYVEFDCGINKWVRREELVILNHIQPKQVSGSNKTDLSEFEARQIIEALRLGIVPNKYVEHFTFGRHKEINFVKNWLNHSLNNALIIEGEYGVGKSHLLRYIHSLAWKENWAVSTVELDPNEVSLKNPRNVYQSMVSSFKWKGGDFKEFLRQIAIADRNNEMKEHKYLGYILEQIKSATDDEELWEWIEGKLDLRWAPRMYKFSTCANIYCYLISGIGWAAKNILGLNGFLILFDEAENVDKSWYSTHYGKNVWNFLKGIIRMANNDEDLLGEPIEFDGNIRRGKLSGLGYCGRAYRIPFLWKIPSGVKLIFVFVPGEFLEEEPLQFLPKMPLNHIEDSILPELSNKVNEIYSTAYNFSLKIKFKSPRKVTNITRGLIKFTIESLDMKRHNPHLSAEELLKYLDL